MLDCLIIADTNACHEGYMCENRVRGVEAELRFDVVVSLSLEWVFDSSRSFNTHENDVANEDAHCHAPLQSQVDRSWARTHVVTKRCIRRATKAST